MYMYIIHVCFIHVCNSITMCMLPLSFVCVCCIQYSVSVEVVDDATAVPAALVVLGYDVTVSNKTTPTVKMGKLHLHMYYMYMYIECAYMCIHSTRSKPGQSLIIVYCQHY